MVETALDLEEEKKQQEAREKRLRCTHGHKLMFYQNGYKRRVNANGNVQQERTDDLYCKMCKAAFKIGTSGYASCLKTCNFFLCSKCVCCRDHPAILMIRQNKKHRDYSEKDWAYC